MMAYELDSGGWKRIDISRQGAVTVLRLHTNGGSLVWDAVAHEELSWVWRAVARDAQTGAVILSGTGDEFCTRIDSPSETKAWLDIWQEARRMLSDMVSLDVPIVSVVNGPAEIHSEVVLLGDIVLASPESTFADRAHIARGIVPGDGIQAVWHEQLGPSRASYHLLTGASISSADARVCGMVHEILPRAALLDRALEIARPLSELPRATLAYTCAVLRGGRRTRIAEAASTGLSLAGLAKISAARG